MNIKIYTFLTIICLILCGCKNETNFKNKNYRENQTLDLKSNDQKILEIKNNFARINAIKNWSRKIVKEIYESTEGGVVTFFYSNEKLEKIVEIHYGETGQNLTEYYFWDEKISFIFEKETNYNRPLYYTKEIVVDADDEEYFDIDKSEITEIRNYLYNDKLIKQIFTNKNDKKAQKNLESEYLRLKKNIEFVMKIEKTQE